MLSKHTGKYKKYYIGESKDNTKPIEIEKVIYYINPKIPFVSAIRISLFPLQNIWKK